MPKRAMDASPTSATKRPLTTVERNAAWLIQAQGIRCATLATSDTVLLCLTGLLSLGKHGLWLCGEVGRRIARLLLFPGDRVTQAAYHQLRSQSGGVLKIPYGICDIPRDTFSGCGSLQDIELPVGLTMIGARCFKNTGLRTITIPATVEGVEDGAFWNCSNLVSVHFEDGDTNIGDHVFAHCHDDLVVTGIF